MTANQKDLPIAHNGCACICHKKPGVIHFMACCHPTQTIEGGRPMSGITVTVAGGAASGKSAIAELIRQALAISGLKVTLTDDNGYGVTDENPDVIAGSLGERLASIVERQSPVVVVTKQLNRESYRA